MIKEKAVAVSTPLFGRSNYMWMIAGALVILIGYLLMAGGKSTDPKIWDESVVNSARRITVAPLLIIIGFVLEIYGILKKAR